MLISSKSTELLRDRIKTLREVFCRGLFLSARWFVLSQAVREGVQIVVLPNREAAEYCAADLYHLIEGDRVFFLPESGRSVERSNYKSSLGVQRTSAIGKLLQKENDELLIIVTYPEALAEEIPATQTIQEAVFRIKKGQEISHDEIIRNLAGQGFEKVDFVSAPGQYAIRGSIVDIFSFSENYPFRISFWGDEIEQIHSFDCNTQLSKEEVEQAEIVSDVVGGGEVKGQPLTDIFPKGSYIWLDSSDMYHKLPFFEALQPFKRIYLDPPLSYEGDDFVWFKISPQPSFNKNFELLTEDIRMKWHVNIGMGAENYRFHDHEKLAHYANAATDIEFNFPFGFKELEGIHSRTNFDLGNHQKFSGKKIEYFDPEQNESYTPYVIETSIGVDRMCLAVLAHSYTVEQLENGEERVVMKIPAPLAPIKVAVMPLVKKDGLPELAQKVVDELKYDFSYQYDEKDSIGKRYRRQDAIGTPFCVTVDHDSLNDGCVTVRDRDNMTQERVKIEDLRAMIEKKVSLTNLLRNL